MRAPLIAPVWNKIAVGAHTREYEYTMKSSTVATAGGDFVSALHLTLVRAVRLDTRGVAAHSTSAAHVARHSCALLQRQRRADKLKAVKKYNTLMTILHLEAPYAC